MFGGAQVKRSQGRGEQASLRGRLPPSRCSQRRMPLPIPCFLPRAPPPPAFMDHRHPSRPPITHADPGPSAEINPQRGATLPAGGLRAHSVRIFTPRGELPFTTQFCELLRRRRGGHQRVLATADKHCAYELHCGNEVWGRRGQLDWGAGRREEVRATEWRRRCLGTDGPPLALQLDLSAVSLEAPPITPPAGPVNAPYAPPQERRGLASLTLSYPHKVQYILHSHVNYTLLAYLLLFVSHAAKYEVHDRTGKCLTKFVI
ncbi:hypothetical protein O3P69_020374 [Scylla paramamosain]|uniref:Uncharacterized protein n=1 Tax=Scylla paramamosain TaxID=85552 RepID=A0AAW0TM90_SCYPA